MTRQNPAVPYFADEGVTLYHGDALEVARTLPDGSVDCCVTSPPYYGLRDYGEPGQYGLESSPAEYVATMQRLFSELRRVLADDGALWLNLGDSYGKDKNQLGIPWRTAFALQDEGWILRNGIVWAKPNTMPEAVTDRLSGKHELLFLLTKGKRYYFDLDAIREPAVTTREGALSWDRPEQGVPGQRPQHRPGRPQRARAEQIAREKGLTQEHLDAIRAAGVTDTGKATVVQTGAGKNIAEVQRLAGEAKEALGGYYREFLTQAGKNPGDVWEIATQPFPGAHFATMPVRLAERCVLAGCKPGGTVLDPFSGSGTTGLASARLGRRYVGIDLNADYLDLSLRTRLQQGALDFTAAGEAS